MVWAYAIVFVISAIAGFMTAPILDALWKSSLETAQTIEQTAPQMAQLFTMMMYMMIITVMLTIFNSIVGLVRD